GDPDQRAALAAALGLSPQDFESTLAAHRQFVSRTFRNVFRMVGMDKEDTADAGADTPADEPDEECALAEQIRQGTLAPGDRLPTEKQLTEIYSVSRAVVREALARLKSEGLITSQQGSGVFVDPNFQRNAFRIAAPSPGDSQDLEHILELMLSIEVTAARYAAQRRTDPDLKKMRQALVGMEYAL
ncbi:FadR/GntR family transcriptional regulator, partial [Escherichia coli]|uniref:FadR/GntR family transcriptional regulator n=1 Tax=Escherichia coli TaxID=562 RepID=UPI0019680EC3